jgi:hypothetical protein
VLEDIQAWRRVVRPQGLLCGHDVHEPLHPGVDAGLKASGIDYDVPVANIWRRKMLSVQHIQLG